MTHRYYRLVGRDVVPIPGDDVLVWAREFEKDRRLRQEWIGGQFVSTVFLGMDHNFFDEGPPLIFESMIFHGPHDEDQARYSTYDEAIKGHEAMVAMLKRETSLWRRELAPLLRWWMPLFKHYLLRYRMWNIKRSLEKRSDDAQ